MNLGDGAYGILKDEELEFLCANATIEELNEVNNAFGGEAATKDPSVFITSGTTVVLKQFDDLKNKKKGGNVEKVEAVAPANATPAAPASATSAKTTAAPVSAAAREWTRDNLSMLAKAVAKYPAGFSNRWGCVANFMNDSLHPNSPYTQDECIKVAFNAAKSKQVVKGK